MKVIIMVRFIFDDIEMDLDIDCCFYYFLEKCNDRWGIVYFILFFDKDCFYFVNLSRIYKILEEEVVNYLLGYRYFVWVEYKIGFLLRLDLDSYGLVKEVFYWKYKDWLEGKSVSLKEVLF